MDRHPSISISLPDELLKKADAMAEDLHVSRSAIITALLSYTFKMKEGIENAYRRQAGQSETPL
jgi:metal-responsive CopG/Arc/MetJ family transcriptional regulator